jgi:YegS/Rv2252/BmrU family lipid kinase
MSTRYLAIINPAARSGQAARLRSAIKEKLSALDVTYRETEGPGDAIDLAAQSAGFDVVIAIGGDGTVHEIVNGLMRIEEDRRPALAVVPLGSGNDTCRMIGAPTDIDEAIEVIGCDRRRPFDLGRCNDRFFVNSFSIGIDALTVTKTTKIKEETGRSGMLLYGQALLQIILFELKPTVLDITVDGVTRRREVLIHTVTNGHTYGGGFKINPSAKPDDGTLTLSHIRWMPMLKVLRSLPALLRGTHPKIDEYDVTEIVSCRFESADGRMCTAQIDGELMEGRSFEIEVRPHALRFVV